MFYYNNSMLRLWSHYRAWWAQRRAKPNAVPYAVPLPLTPLCWIPFIPLFVRPVSPRTPSPTTSSPPASRPSPSAITSGNVGTTSPPANSRQSPLPVSASPFYTSTLTACLSIIPMIISPRRSPSARGHRASDRHPSHLGGYLPLDRISPSTTSPPHPCCQSLLW